MSHRIGGLGRRGFVLGLSTCLAFGAGVIAADDGHGRAVLVAQKTQKKKPAAKKGDDPMAKADPAPAAKGAKPATPPAEGDLSFKRDIAPILVANCLNCHSGNGQGVRRSKLDMSTFDKLLAGGQRGKDIVGGDPEGSMLVQMIMGQESPKMPPNNGQRGFSDDAAGKIVAWVKQGAKLDAGIVSTEPINKYAATLEDLRGAELAKLSPEERDKAAEAAGRDRWKKASKLEPEVTTSKTSRFLLLSTLPKDRATKLLQVMDKQYDAANKLLSTGRTPILNPVEKIGLYVFKEQAPFVEFVRSVENADVEAGELARAKLTVESPYIVAVDPAAGGEEAAPARKGVRGKKKADESAGGPDRSLAGVLTEQLFAGAATKAGKPPKWVPLGLGAYMASQLEPRSPYYMALRKETARNIQAGWQPKAQAAMGGEEKAETIRAIGFSLFEWMAANVPPATLGNFVQIMLDGPNKTDDAINQCLGGTRQEFLEHSELWLAEKYGR